MTWRELKQFILKMDNRFLNSSVKLYDYYDGEEYSIDITELLINEANKEDANDGWVPYLCINNEDNNDENQTKETSINRIS